MNCDRARELLWPPERPQLASPAILEAREHVRTCEACSDYLAQDEALVAAFRSSREIQAPPEVRERIFDALARERTAAESRRSQSRMLTALSVAALFALATLPAVNLLVTRPSQNSDRAAEGAGARGIPTDASFVEDFLRRAVQAEHIQTSDPTEVARFLARELDMERTIPLAFPRFDLAGAEICIVEGVRGAVVVYKRDGKVLYHYLIPKDGGNTLEPSLSAARPPEWSGLVEFPAVVTWASHGIQQALVSDVSPNELLALARELATQG